MDNMLTLSKTTKTLPIVKYRGVVNANNHRAKSISEKSQKSIKKVKKIQGDGDIHVKVPMLYILKSEGSSPT